MTQNSIESSSGQGVVVNSNVNVSNDNHNHSTTMVTTDNNNVNPPIAAPIQTSSTSTTATTCTPMATTNVRRIRRYRIFPGRNRFFCDGRIIMAKQISVFYFTVALLVGTCVCFFIFDSPYLSNKISPLVPIVAAFLFLFVLFCLFRTSFTDPGILPRATPAEAADVEQQIVPNQSNSSTMRPPPRTKEVMINNQMIKLKYCFTCKIFRPPRASHCSLCDNCVERFDHHCPWVGNCVGKRNYRFFYMFIVSLAFLCIYVFSCIITHFILLSKTMTFVEAVKQSPVSVVEMIICFFSVWSILGLAGFHTYLIMSNLTTNEDIKGSFSKRNHVSIKNPYSQGSIFRNCYSILCAPIGPSLIHRRSYVYCEESIITTAASASASPAANNCNSYHHQPISSSSAATAKQSQSIRFAANVAYPLQPTISGQQQQQQSIPVMANYYHHNHHAHLQQPNKSPQIISHQLKQSNGQSQYYVPIIKNSNQSQQHLHPDSHGQVYLGHDIDELDKQQQRLATQHHYYQQPAQSDNMLISESFNANDPLHHHHHYQTCAQQACYYHQKSSSSSSPSFRHHSNVAPPQSDNYATTMIIDPYYPNLAKKNSPSIMIDTDNDYCNYPTQHFIHNSNSNSNSNSNQQKSTTIPTTSCSHHHNHHHHHHHAANSSKASSSTGSCNSTTTYQSRSSSTNQPHSQPKRSQTTVKGQTQPPSTKQTNKIN